MRKFLWAVLILLFSGNLAFGINNVSIGVVNDSRKIGPREKISSDKWIYNSATNTVDLYGAKNEIISFQIILRAKKRLEIANAFVQWEDNDAFKTDLFYESYLFAPEVPKKEVAEPAGEYPDPLIPFWDPGQKKRPVALPFVLAPKRNQPIWVDIQIPARCQAKVHKGVIRFRTGEGVRIKVNLQVHVWNFTLPAQQHLHAWIPLYWERLAEAEKLNPKTIFLQRNWPVVLRYYKMAHDHGFVTQITNGVDQPDIEWDERTGKILSIDWRAYDRYFGPILSGKAFADGTPPSIWKVGGWLWWGLRDGDKPFFGGDYQKAQHLTPAYKMALRSYTQAIENHFEEKGWTNSELFWYLIDEPDFESYPQLKTLIREITETIHAVTPNIKHMVTISPGLNPDMIGAVDIWAATGGTYWVPAMQARQRHGEEAWFYQDRPPFVGGQCLNQNGLSLRTWPWIARRYGVDGIFLWVGDFWPDDVYKNAVNWNSDNISNGIIFYPGGKLPEIGFPAIRGPVSSFRMKEWRRGMEDYAYFQLAGKEADPIVKKIIHSALNPNEYNPYWRDPLWAHEGDWNHNPKDWEMARRKLAEIILIKKNKKSP